MASEKVLCQKKEKVLKLVEKMKTAKIILLTDYRGINVSNVTNLRTKLRDARVEYRVMKNNIIRRALQECKIEGLEDALKGPTAIIIENNDYLEACKIVHGYAKGNECYKIKGGVIDGKVVSVEEIEMIAELPSRETLIAQLAGALCSNITKFAVVLNQVVKQKTEQVET